MLHLLPDYQKKKVVTDYRIRLTIVALFALCAGVLTFIIFIAPAYGYLLAERLSLQSEKNVNESIVQGTDEDVLGGVDLYTVAKTLKPATKEFTPLAYISAVTSTSSGIVINSYSFVREGDKDLKVSISGVAKTRENLSTYADFLNSKFGGVKLPLSSLAQPSNIQFEFKFKMRI